VSGPAPRGRVAAAMYYATTGVTSAVLTAEEALADWDDWDPGLREGDPETGFELYVRSREFGFRFAPATYTPLLGEGGPCSTSR
jgi:hypothetical protein